MANVALIHDNRKPFAFIHSLKLSSPPNRKIGFRIRGVGARAASPQRNSQSSSFAADLDFADIFNLRYE